ncbi:unnamed protein product [Lampetra fluviatilis]
MLPRLGSEPMGGDNALPGARGYRFKEEEIEIASVRRINKLLRPSTNRWRGGRRHSPPVAFPPAAVAAAGHPARCRLLPRLGKCVCPGRPGPRRTSWTTFSAGRWRDGVCQDRLQDDLRCVPTTPSVIVATQTWTGATASCAGGVQCTCRGNVDAKFHIALPSIAKSFDFMKELQKEIRET